jgi:hypothetical protein
MRTWGMVSELRFQIIICIGAMLAANWASQFKDPNRTKCHDFS